MYLLVSSVRVIVTLTKLQQLFTINSVKDILIMPRNFFSRLTNKFLVHMPHIEKVQNFVYEKMHNFIFDVKCPFLNTFLKNSKKFWTTIPQ